MYNHIIKYYHKYVNIIFITVIILIIFGIGYFMGFKGGFEENKNSLINTQQEIQSNDVVQIDIEKLKSEDQDLKLFKFIKPNEPKICTDPYTIKAVYRSGFGYFYDKSNTFYDRVKPDLCFVSIEAARDWAGFIQKY